jgi:hypothetical protein
MDTVAPELDRSPPPNPSRVFHVFSVIFISPKLNNNLCFIANSTERKTAKPRNLQTKVKLFQKSGSIKKEIVFTCIFLYV